MAEYIVIERTDAKQGFHVRFVNHGNARRTFWSENYTSRAKAIKAILNHAATFAGDRYVKIGKAPLVASGLALLVLDWDQSTEVAQVEIREVDSRTPKKA